MARKAKRREWTAADVRNLKGLAKKKTPASKIAKSLSLLQFLARGPKNQIIVDYEVYARRPNDSDLLIPAIETHQAKLGRVPRLVAADAGFYSGKNEAAAKAMGVKREIGRAHV